MWALIATVARAQASFEVHVYERETVPKGRWNLETHINYIGKGTKFFEGKFGRFQFEINPILKRALRGPGTKDGGILGPCMRLGYGLHNRLDLSMEYYSDLGPLTDLLLSNRQAHQIYPGGNLKFGDNTVVTFGVGFGATHMGNRLIYKIRIGHLF
jgi:hypothetical protein